MQRSILVLCLALSLIVVLTMLIFEEAPTAGEKAAISMGAAMPLSPLQYSSQLDHVSTTRDTSNLADVLERAHELRRRGEYAKAEDIFRTALMFDPENADTAKAIGQLAFRDRRYDQAVNYFSIAFDLRSNSVESYTNLAIAFICAERYDDADALVQRGLNALGGDDAGPFYFLSACIRDKRGDTDEADRYLNLAYSELGDDLFKLVNSSWSASLRDLPAYRSLVSAR